jgi:ABC-2 type transport system permease protein
MTGTTTGALAYLAAITQRNRITLFFKRLRNPRYLVSTIAAIAYFYTFVGRRAFHGGATVKLGMAVANPIVANVCAALLFIVMTIVWAWPSATGGIVFSEAEVQFLFTAPLTKRQLILYKFLGSQLQIIISTIMMSLLALRGANPIGMWLVMMSLSMYMTMVGQLRARLRRMGIGFIVRFITVVGLLGVSIWTFAYQHFKAPLIEALLFVPRLFVYVALPSATPEWRLASAIAVIGGAILFFFIASSVDVSFQEESLLLSQQRVKYRDRMQSGQSGRFMAFKRLPPPFRLGDGGPPEIAIYWKNLIATLRIGLPLVLILVLVTMLVALEITFVKPDRQLANLGAGVLLMMACLLPLFGGRAFSQDLRLDINRIEFLKTFPVPSDRLVMAEIAAPLTVLATLELLLLSSTSIFFATRGSISAVAHHWTPQVTVVAFIFAVPVCAMQLLLGNAAVLMFPAWMVRSKDEPRGFAAMGQRLVIGIGNLVVLAIAVLPAAVLFLPALLIANHFFAGSPGFLAVATLPSVALLVAEVWLGVKMLGKRFDAFDPATELDRILA